MINLENDKKTKSASRITLISLKDSRENEFEHDLGENSFDFKPLYRAIHIFGVLNKLNELVLDFEEQRRLQANLLLVPKFSISKKDIKLLKNFLNDTAGFFIIEKIILKTTNHFRSPAAVEILWEQAIRNIEALVQNCIAETAEADLLIEIKDFVIPFSFSLQENGYNTGQVISMLETVFERYCDLIKQNCSEKLHKLTEEYDCIQTSAANSDEMERIKTLVRLKECSKMRASSFPFKFRFSKLIPGVCEAIYEYVDHYFKFAIGFNMLAPIGMDLDEVAAKVIDNLLVRYINQPLLSIIESSKNLTEVLQIYIDFEFLANSSIEIENYLSQKRLRAESSKGSIQACETFLGSRILGEKRIFQLFNTKISEHLSVAEYDFMAPSSSAATGRMPSVYLRDLVNFLTSVIFNTFESLGPELRAMIYFESFDYLATKMMDMLLSPNVRRINMAFVEQFAVDISFLEKFAVGLGDENVKDAFLVLRQAVNLMQAENPVDYLDPNIEHKKYNRLKHSIVISLFEKLNNAAGLFAHKSDKAKRKGYEAVISALKKEKENSSSQSSPNK